MNPKAFGIFSICILFIFAAIFLNANQASLANSSEVSDVIFGDPGFSFRYVKTFGTVKEPYIIDTNHLNRPTGLFIDISDNVYVVEQAGFRTLKYDLAGNNLLAICNAGIDFSNYQVLCRPQDVTTDIDSNIWVADGNRIIQYDTSWQILQQVPEDDPGEPGNGDYRFDGVKGIAIDKNNHLFISDGNNHRIQVFDISGGSPVYSTTIGTGGADGSFNQPYRIAIDSNDNLFVADSANNRVQKCTYSSGWACSTFDVGLSKPRGITADGLDIYIADTENGRIRACIGGGACSDFVNTPGWVYDVAVDSYGNVYGSLASKAAIYKYDSNGTPQGVFLGVEDVPYTTNNDLYNHPRVTIDRLDHIIIIEEHGQRLLKLDSQGNLLWLSPIGSPGVDAANGGYFNYPRGVTTDANNNIYVADGDRVQIFNSNGVPQSPLEDNFSWVTGIAVDGDGKIYVSDAGNHRVEIYDSDHVTHVGGIGEPGVCGDGENQLCRPMGLEVDPNGNIYVSDSGNYRVRKFDSNPALVKTLGTGDKGEAFDQFGSPEDIAIDKDGRIYVADTSNNRVQVFDDSGAYLTTIGGTWGSQSSRFRNVSGVALDSAGNLYVSDFDNARIQKFAPDVPGWEQVNINGFSVKLNRAIISLEEFGEYLYAGTFYGPWGGENGGRIWRSKDGQIWEPASDIGLGKDYDYNKAVLDMVEFNEMLYASSYRGWAAQIWRCEVCDRSDWEKIVSEGFENDNNYAFDRLTVFKGFIYAAASNSEEGVEIWRSATGEPYPGDWKEMLSTGNGDKFNTNILSFAEFGGNLYAGVTNEKYGAEIWETSDGDIWTATVTNGFTDVNNIRIESLAVFNNDLYAGTHNWNTGAEIYRSTNGEDWDLVMEGGFGDDGSGDGPMNYSVNSLIVIGGELYALTSNDETGIEVWRTSDGTNWEEQVNPDGFGDDNNKSATTANYLDKLYVATWNDANGGEIWRMLSGDSTTVDPESDSTLSYDDPSGSEIDIDIKAGSVSATTELQFTVVSEVPESAGFAFAGTAFTLDAYVDDLLQPEFTFNLPITITFKYTDQQVFELDEDTLILEYWDGSTWQDAACGPYDRHPDENWLSVPICHLTEFGWFGEAKSVIYLPFLER